MTFSLTLKVADTQDRLVPSDMVLQEPFLRQTQNTDQFSKLTGFLTRDPRMKERKKYGLKAARRAPQFSKR